MRVVVPAMFATITAKLEDTHSIAVEGQWRDHPLGFERVLACHLRIGIAALDWTIQEIKQRRGDDHD